MRVNGGEIKFQGHHSEAPLSSFPRPLSPRWWLAVVDEVNRDEIPIGASYQESHKLSTNSRSPCNLVSSIRKPLYITRAGGPINKTSIAQGFRSFYVLCSSSFSLSNLQKFPGGGGHLSKSIYSYITGRSTLYNGFDWSHATLQYPHLNRT